SVEPSFCGFPGPPPSPAGPPPSSPSPPGGTAPGVSGDDDDDEHAASARTTSAETSLMLRPCIDGAQPRPSRNRLVRGLRLRAVLRRRRAGLPASLPV